jgi:hypothetical protein
VGVDDGDRGRSSGGRALGVVWELSRARPDQWRYQLSNTKFVREKEKSIFIAPSASVSHLWDKLMWMDRWMIGWKGDGDGSTAVRFAERSGVHLTIYLSSVCLVRPPPVQAFIDL